jgi:hypothetical protein
MRKIKFGLFSVTGDYAEALNSAKRADAEGFIRYCSTIISSRHFGRRASRSSNASRR